MQEEKTPLNGAFRGRKEDAHKGDEYLCGSYLSAGCQLMDLFQKRSLLVNGTDDEVVANEEAICAIHDKIADDAASGLADVIAKAKLLYEFIGEAGAPKSLEARLAQSLVRELEWLALIRRDSFRSPRR